MYYAQYCSALQYIYIYNYFTRNISLLISRCNLRVICVGVDIFIFNLLQLILSFWSQNLKKTAEFFLLLTDTCRIS